MIGALDTSGRELCGSAWKTDFESVKISAARIQQLPSNTEKLTEHSGKLKSSLMYELDTYLEAWKEFPDKLPVLETTSGKYYPQKTDVLQRKVWYSPSPDSIINPVEVSLHRLLEIQRENQKGNKPPLDASGASAMEQPLSFTSGTFDILEKNSSPGKQSSSKKPSSSKKKKKRKKNRSGHTYGK